MCQCLANADRTVVVCDSCATRVLMNLLGVPLEQEDTKPQTKTTVIFTSTEHHSIVSRVNGWLDELEVAVR